MTYPVVELDSLDNLLIGIEQGSDIIFLLDELDVSDNDSSGCFGLVQIILNLWTLGETLVFSIDMLVSSAKSLPPMI